MSSPATGYLENDPHFATKALHVGQEPEQWTAMSVVPQISMATTYKQDAPAQYRDAFGFFWAELK